MMERVLYNKKARMASPVLMSVFVVIAVMLILSGCSNALSRLKEVGNAPPLKEVMSQPVSERLSTPVRWPHVQAASTQEERGVNSLWSQGSKAFFNDKRARRIGDILRVKVKIQDKAELDNKTERKRDNTENLGVNSLFGLQSKIVSLLPGQADATNLLDLSGTTDSTGEGNIEREEVIETEVAAVVTQVLPGGNLFIYGSQEILVNYEVRQLTVEGVVRPEDVSPTNEVMLNQIAEARVSYGGRGLISDLQQPRYGNQVIDILSPW